MTEVFLGIVEMNLYASIVIVLTIVLRLFFKKKSKRLMMILWIAVAIRLLVPINIESSVSLFNLFPDNMNITEAEIIDNAVNISKGQSYNTNIDYNDAVATDTIITYNEPLVNEKTTGIKDVLAIIWALGVTVIMCYCVIRYLILKRETLDAVLVEEGIKESNKITSPFVLGIIKPIIYLPVGLNENEKIYILSHEKIHIKRRDSISKIIGMVAVAIHWFNPIVWVGYMFFNEDIEMSCDEQTVEEMGEEIKKAYSKSLVYFATKKEEVSYRIVPLNFIGSGFGKSEVKKRVENIMNYKKGSKFMASVLALFLLIISTACSLNAKENVNKTEVKIEESEKLEVFYVCDNENENPMARNISYANLNISFDDSELDENRKLADIGSLDKELKEVLGKSGFSGDSEYSTEENQNNIYPVYRLGMNSSYEKNAYNSITVDIYKYESEEMATESFYGRLDRIAEGQSSEFDESIYSLDKEYSYIAVDADNNICGKAYVLQKNNYIIMVSESRVLSETFGREESNTEYKIDEETLNDVLDVLLGMGYPK